jgi:hypothetical protein
MSAGLFLTTESTDDTPPHPNPLPQRERVKKGEEMRRRAGVKKYLSNIKETVRWNYGKN